MRNRADLYMVGHEHSVQHLKPDSGEHCFVGAAAGQTPRTAKTGPLTVFTGAFCGFTVLDINAERIQVSCLDTGGKTRYQTEMRK